MTFLVLMLCLVNGGPDRGEVLARAKAAQDAGRFEDALSLYAKVLVPEGDDAGPILFNMGIAAAAIGRFAEAKAHLLGADRRLHGAAVVKDALDVVNRALGRGSVPSPRGVSALVDSPDVRLLVCSVLEVLGLVLALRRRSSRRLVLAGLLCVVGALAWGTTELVAEARSPDRLAVILKEETTCLVEPMFSSGPAFRLAAGAVVRVEALSDRWARIVWRGEAAWVPRGDVALVE